MLQSSSPTNFEKRIASYSSLALCVVVRHVARSALHGSVVAANMSFNVAILQKEGRAACAAGSVGLRNDKWFRIARCVNGWLGFVLPADDSSLIFLFWLFRRANTLFVLLSICLH